MARQLIRRNTGCPGQAGFSLLELLVVVAILATLAVSVQIVLPSGRLAHVEDRAAIASLLKAQRQLAVFSGQSRGLALDRRALQPLKLDGDVWKPDGRRLAFKGSVVLSGDRADPDFDGGGGGWRPDILLSPNGAITAFEVMLRKADQGGVLLCEPDLHEGLTCSD